MGDRKMQFKLLSSLGLDDARKCNKDLGTNLPLKASDLAAGATVDLTSDAVTYLKRRYRGAVGLLEEVTGNARSVAIKGVKDGEK
jgi:hypothetical protein